MSPENARSSSQVLYENRVKGGLFAIQCSVTTALHAFREGSWIAAYEYVKVALEHVSALQNFVEQGVES